MRIRRFLSFAGMLLLILVAIPSQSFASASDSRAFMTDVGNRVLQLLNDRQAPAADREQKFGKLVVETFDVPRISRFVLGQNWRTASVDERQQFAQVFQAYLIKTYWSLFSQYSGQSFAATGEQAQSDALTLVTMQIVQPAGKPTIKVDWVVRKEGDTLKVIDVSIAGVSQVLTYREEFASFLDSNGGHISALIAELNKRMRA